MEVSSWRYDPWEAWVEMGVQPPTAKIGCTYVVISFFRTLGKVRCSEIRFVTRRLVETFCGMGGVQGSHSKIQYIKITP